MEKNLKKERDLGADTAADKAEGDAVKKVMAKMEKELEKPEILAVFQRLKDR